MTPRTPLLAGALMLLLLVPLARLVPLNQDEGWYLLATRRVAEGFTPYTDFTFTQAPAFPYLTLPAQPLIRAGGLYAARIVQALLLSLATVLLLRTLRPPRPAESILLFVLLLAPLYLQFGLTVKTYALTTVFLLAAAGSWLQTPKRGSLIAAALFLALAAATRISFAPLLLPPALSLFLRRNRIGHTPWITCTLTAALALLLLFGPFLLRDPRAFLFQTLTFHTLRQHPFPSIVPLGILLRALHTALPLLALAALTRQPFRTLPPEERALWQGLALTALLHLAAPHPYDEYLTPLYPLAVLLLGRAALRANLPAPHLRRFALLTLLFHLSSPHLHAWIPLETDRIWNHPAPKTGLATLEHAARILRQHATPESRLYTPDAYLAIQANLDLPRGLEMGPFSFNLRTPRPGFMDLSDIETALAQCDLAAFTPYHFIHSPEILPFTPQEETAFRTLLERHFTPLTTLPNFGQHRLPLEIWVRGQH